MADELVRYDNFYRNALDNLPGCFLVIDSRTGIIQYANKKFADDTGYTEDDLRQGMTFGAMLEEGQHERFLVQMELTRKYPEKKERYVIYDIRRKDAGHLKAGVYINPALDHDDGQGQYHVFLVPEHSRWTLPFRSFDTREMFLQMFSGFGFGTFEWILESNRLYWSDGLYEIYEISKNIKTITPEYAEKFTHPEDLKYMRAVVQRTMEKGEPCDIDIRIITQSRNLKYLNCVGRLLRGKDGAALKVVGSIRDITDQKENEDALKRHLLELNRSNRELEEFAYVTSHDLQEPLRKVSTFSDRLYERIYEDLDEDGKFYLHRIMAAASNMRQLINNLLEFSRVTKGNLLFSEVSLDFIIKEVRSDLEIKIAETGAVIEKQDMPVIEADPLQMRQLFMNLIGNAIKFKKADVVPVIRISSRELSEEEKLKHSLRYKTVYHKIVIEDNGIGFEEEYANRIFQIFQRLHGKAEFPGSGIGLAICKKIVDHHQGTIYAESVIDKGSRFIIILPQKQV